MLYIYGVDAVESNGRFKRLRSNIYKDYSSFKVMTNIKKSLRELHVM